MALDVNTALTKAYDELRTIDMDLSSLSGVQDRFSRKRQAGDFGGGSSAVGERRVQEGGRKIIVGPESSMKRGRYSEDQGGPNGGSRHRDERDYSPPSSRTHRTLSSVVMPTTIETKSRTAIINEKKKSENKEDLVRNRRLFSNLLVGTLRQFQKEEKTVGSKGQAQIEKQREVERRLEETEKENRERLLRERDSLMAKRREKEMEIQALRRQKAIEQSAEEKMKHFRRLACFIQTQTKPPLFFLPAKHTLRTLELLNESSKKIETLIEMRREEKNRELKRLDIYMGGQNAGDKDDSDQEYDGKNSGGLKSAVVVKTEQQGNNDEENPTAGNDGGNGGGGGGSEHFNQDDEMDNPPNNNNDDDDDNENTNDGQNAANDSGEMNDSTEGQDGNN